MRRIAIIPARGGSKRLPRKNVLPFMGRPMLAHPVHACLDSGLFDRVIVSTEDEEIAAVAQAAGAEVLHRDSNLATDHAGVAKVCADTLHRLSRTGFEPVIFCCLYATAVFVTSDDLHHSLALMEAPPEVDGIMGVSLYNLQPHVALREDNGFLSPMWPELINHKSQEMPRLVASNGTLYWLRTAAFRVSQTFYLRRLRGYEMPRHRVIDIDTDEDYRMALLLAETANAKP